MNMSSMLLPGWNDSFITLYTWRQCTSNLKLFGFRFCLNTIPTNTPTTTIFSWIHRNKFLICWTIVKPADRSPMLFLLSQFRKALAFMPPLCWGAADPKKFVNTFMPKWAWLFHVLLVSNASRQKPETISNCDAEVSPFFYWCSITQMRNNYCNCLSQTRSLFTQMEYIRHQHDVVLCDVFLNAHGKVSSN